MAADTFDPILGLLLMGTGNDNNSWGTNANNSDFTPIAQAIAGVNTISTTGGTTDLSTVAPPAGLRLDIAAIQIISGAITSDVTIKVPNVSKRTLFINNTTGAFNCFVQVPGGVSPSGLRQIPQGHKVEIICDGNGNLFRGDGDQIGRLITHAGTTAPGGALICNGASLLRAEYPDLFNVIGTTWGSADSLHFTLPLLTDTNRFLRAGGGSGPAVGTYQSNQNASHTHTQATGTISGTTDSQGAHTHGATSTDSGHTHQVTSTSSQGGGGNTFFIQQPAGSVATGTGFANITTTIASAGAHTHNVSGSATVTLNSQGGSEARPESAAALICIRY